VMVLVGVVAEDGYGLAQRGPDIVEVDACSHDANDDLEGPGLGDPELFDLESVNGFAEALLADDPGGHAAGKLTQFGIDIGDLAQIDGHGPAFQLGVKG